MTLNEEQKQIVAGWVAAGDSLSAVQKKLNEHLKISMTYMDVRFLVDDLNLQLKDPAPKASTDLSKPSAPPPEPAHPPGAAAGEEEEPYEEAPAGASAVLVTVDKVTLIPGAIASGTVSFSDGVTGKWIVDHQGRPGFTSISKENYRPTPADAQAFMQELSAALQQRGV